MPGVRTWKLRVAQAMPPRTMSRSAEPMMLRAPARVRMAREQNPPLPDPDLRTHFPKPTGQSKVTGDINHSRGKILLCLYLFVTLAPVDSAVTRTGDMNNLLDAVFGPRNNLPTHHRRLLQKAGACLENRIPGGHRRTALPVPDRQPVQNPHP